MIDNNYSNDKKSNLISDFSIDNTFNHNNHEPQVSYTEDPILIEDSGDIEDLPGAIWSTSGADEYEIQNVIIDASGNSYGIKVSGYSALDLTLRNVSVVNVETPKGPDGTTLIQRGDPIYLNYTNAGLYLENTGIIKIEEFTSTGNYFGIYADNVNALRIEDSEISDSTCCGIYLNNVENTGSSIIQQNNIYNNYYCGLYMKDCIDMIISNSKSSNGNGFYQNQKNHIYLKNSNGTTIKDNDITYSDKNGIKIEKGKNNEISYNYISHCGNGIKIQNSIGYINVSHNDVEDCLSSGIHLTSCLNADVNDNTANNNLGDGIVFGGNINEMVSEEYYYNGSLSTDVYGNEYFSVPRDYEYNFQDAEINYRELEIYAYSKMDVTIGPEPTSALGLSAGEAYFDLDNGRVNINPSEPVFGATSWIPASENTIQVRYTYSTTVLLDNNEVSYNQGNGIIVSQSNETTISNTHAHQNSQAGIRVEQGGSNNIFNNIDLIENKYGLVLSGEISSEVDDNDFSDQYYSGISVEDSIDVYLHHNDIDNNGKNGIFMHSGSEQIRIENSQISDNGENGIYLEGNHNSIENSMKIYENGNNGILITGDENNIQQCEIYSNGENGIQIDGNGNFIGQNFININMENGVYINGSNSKIWENSEINLNQNAGIYIEEGSSNANISQNLLEYSGIFIAPDSQTNLKSHNIKPTNYINGDLIRYWKDTNGTFIEDFNSYDTGKSPPSWTHVNGDSIVEYQADGVTFRVQEPNYDDNSFTSNNLVINDDSSDYFTEGYLDLENEYDGAIYEFDVFVDYDGSTGSSNFYMYLEDEADQEIIGFDFNINNPSAASGQWELGIYNGTGAYSYSSSLDLNTEYHVSVELDGTNQASLSIDGVEEVSGLNYNGDIISQIHITSVQADDEGTLMLDNLKFNPTSSNYGAIILAYCDEYQVNNLELNDSSCGIQIINSNNCEINNVVLGNHTMYGLYVYESDNLYMNDLTIDQSAIGIYCKGSENLIISNLEITQSSFDGMKFQSVLNSHLENIYIENSGLNGLNLTGQDNKITGTSNVSLSGMYGAILTGYNNSIYGCNFVDNDKGSIYTFNQNEGELLSLDIRDTTVNNDQSVLIHDSNGIKFENNRIENHQTKELHLSDSQSISIKNNEFIVNGIYLSGDSEQDYNTHSVDDNTLGSGSNKKPISFFINKIDESISPFCNQLILVNCNETEIRNLNITGSYAPIQYYYSSNNIIMGKQASKGTIEDGIYANIIMENSDNNLIQFMKIQNSANNGHGIICLDGDGNDFKDLYVFQNDVGLWMDNSQGTTISNCVFEANNKAIILNRFSEFFIKNNQFNQQFQTTLDLSNGDLNFIEDNSFNTPGAESIILTSTNFTYFRDNEFSHLTDNMAILYGSNYNSFQNHDIEDIDSTLTLVFIDQNSENNFFDRINGDFTDSTNPNNIGFWIEGDDNEIQQVDIENAYRAIYASNVDGLEIHYNLLQNCNQGLYLYTVKNVLIRYNTISSCTNEAIIILDNSEGVSISRNRFTESKYAVYVDISLAIDVVNNYYCNNTNMVVQSGSDVNWRNYVVCGSRGAGGEDGGITDSSDDYNTTEAPPHERVVATEIIIAFTLIGVGALLGTFKFKRGKGRLHMTASDQ